MPARSMTENNQQVSRGEQFVGLRFVKDKRLRGPWIMRVSMLLISRQKNLSTMSVVSTRVNYAFNISFKCVEYDTVFYRTYN